MKLVLSSVQKKQINKIAKKYGIIFAVVFGSAAQSRQKPESDFDIAVLLKKATDDYETFSRLFGDLSTIFRGQNVDLRFLNDADPFFRYEVVKDGQLIYGNKEDYNQFKIYINKIYIDDGRKFFPYLEQLLANNQKKLEKSIL